MPGVKGLCVWCGHRHYKWNTKSQDAHLSKCTAYQVAKRRGNHTSAVLVPMCPVFAFGTSRPAADLSYLFEMGGTSSSGGGNTTETVVSTSTGTSLINVGSYRHFSTALTAYDPQVSGPETYLALLTAPFFPMSA